MKAPLPTRVTRIGRKLAARAERIKAKDPKSWGSKPLRKKEFRLRRRTMIAYDLETSRIKAGETPRVKYLTAFGAAFRCSARLSDTAQLLSILHAQFLLPEFNNARFVAWNGNHFDVYLIAQAILGCDEFILRPYLTRSKNLRGLRVIRREKWKDHKGKFKTLAWEFLDGISMTGLVGTPLKSRVDPMTGEKIKGFLTQFAPEFDYQIGPDFAKEEFDAANPDHIKYAERDSEGLYIGLERVENIVAETFGMALQPTIGNLGIKLFQMNMPVTATVWKPPFACLDALRSQVMRGGFCFRARRHDGGVWKYDLNQAYAAAMREAKLPAGRCYWNACGIWRKAEDRGALNPYASTYVARVRGVHPRNKVPFYCRDMEGEPHFSTTEIPETWLTSIEYKQLLKEGARLEVAESYFWDDQFSMKGFVDRLEVLRGASEGGPSGPQGIVVKMIGNNAYGKTVERLDGIELIMALNCPEGYNHYQSENDQLQCVWYRFAEPITREYHQPQLGAFITAHVRMVLRRAILLAPDAWIYADTDCVVFDRAVPLPVDPKKYGLWKQEEAGERDFLFIEKKVYASRDGKVKHAKGMNVRDLKMLDFEEWYRNRPPSQSQVQRNNFVSFIAGADMFKSRVKVGQRL